MRARYYDPQTGQFLTRDPLEALTHERYAYAADDPVDVVDPSGLDGIFGTGIGPTIGPQVNGVTSGRRTRGSSMDSPVRFGGTAAIRDILGLNGGLDKCSSLHKLERTIGQVTGTVATGAPQATGVASAIGGAATGLGGGAAAGAEGSSEITSVGAGFNTIAEATGHHLLFAGTSIGFTVTGVGATTWISGDSFSNLASPSTNCGCS